MEEEVKRLNFLEEIIEDDLKSGKVESILTRFPPEPNGYLHLGHAKSLCINFGLAQKYGGKTNLRYDDTNPTKEDTEYVDAIKEDIKWLGFQWEKECYASDYFDQLYEWAEWMIQQGLAYVDDQTQEEMRENRGTVETPGKNSPWRDRTPEENLKLFREMRDGKYADGEKVLRAKIDMAHPKMEFRDPIMYRIKHAHHHRTGDKWCIYPMYDYTHGQSDSIEHITHSICTLEFDVHRPLYDWYIKTLGIYPSHQYEFARLNLTYTLMSKRKLLELVQKGIVSGWDDPRMPTLCGVRRRGYTAEIEEVLQKHIDIMDTIDPEGRVDLLLDEWGTWFDVEPGTNPGHLYQQNTMRDAIVAALNFDIFHKYTRRLKMANIAQVVNVLQAMILTNETEMVLTPTYHVFEMYNVHQNAEFVASDILTKTVKSDRKCPVPEVDATVSRKDGVMNISLVNTDLKKAKKVLITFDNEKAVSAVTAARVLTSKDVHDYNDFGKANVVEPKAFKDYKLTKAGLEVTLPPCSIAVLAAK